MTLWQHVASGVNRCARSRHTPAAVLSSVTRTYVCRKVVWPGSKHHTLASFPPVARASCSELLQSDYSWMRPQPSKRNLWGWLNTIFNRVDENRIKEVGPDRACAEWLLRCGALVKWRNKENWTKDYNLLPQTGGKLLKIEEIDATDSAVMHIGFPHFKGCKHIQRIVFHKASYLDDEALSQLTLLRESLRDLQISSCGNITVDGLRNLKKLEKLQYLLLYDLPEIDNKEAILQELQEALPNCTVLFPYAQAKEDPNL